MTMGFPSSSPSSGGPSSSPIHRQMDKERLHFGTANNRNDNMGDNEIPSEEAIVQNILAQIEARNQKIRMLVAYLMCLVAQVFCLINTESTSSSKRSNKRKAKNADVVPTQLEAISTAISRVAEALRETNSLAVRSTLRIYSEEEVYNELKEIEVASSWRMEAYLFLTNNPPKARQFFGVPREDRLEFLVRMMQSATGSI